MLISTKEESRMDVFIGPYFSRYYQEYPLTLIDIGARGGLEKNWQCAKRYLKTIGFEPDKQEFNNLIHSLDNKSITYFNTALYEKKTTLDFNIMRERGLSSILKPNREFIDRYPDSGRYDILQTIKIEVDTLDNVLNKNKNIDVDFIKLDAQGSELSILKGANNILSSSVIGLEIEVEFVQLYQDQPIFSEINEFIKNFGFRLFDLRTYFWKTYRGMKYGKPKGQIIFADALFIIDIDKFLTILNRMQVAFLRKPKVWRAISVCFIYGYLDYAFEIFEATKNLFGDEEITIFNRKITREIFLARKIPNFKGKNRISDLLRSLANFIHPSNNSWVYWRRDLGNIE